MKKSNLKLSNDLILKNLRLLMCPIILLSLLFITFQSCNKDSDSQRINANINTKLEFLDADVPFVPSLIGQQKDNFKKANLNDQQIIFKKALTRIDPYVVYKNKSYKLTVSKGSEIQMSERLFEYFKVMLNQTNSDIKDLNIVSDKNDSRKLYVVKQSKLDSNVRLKSVETEEKPGLNTTAFGIHWWGVEIYISSHDLNRLTLGCTAAAIIGAFSPDPTISKAVAVIGGISAATFGYWAAEHPNGIVITCYAWGVYNTVSSQGADSTEAANDGSW